MKGHFCNCLVRSSVRPAHLWLLRQGFKVSPRYGAQGQAQLTLQHNPTPWTSWQPLQQAGGPPSQEGQGPCCELSSTGTAGGCPGAGGFQARVKTSSQLRTQDTRPRSAVEPAAQRRSWDTHAHPGDSCKCPGSTHTHSFTCSRAPGRGDKPAETATAAPGSCEQGKMKKPAPLVPFSPFWVECLSHKLGIQRTSQCPQAAAGWRLRSARTVTPSKSRRLLCKNRAATFSSGGKDTTEEFPEKGILVGVNE